MDLLMTPPQDASGTVPCKLRRRRVEEEEDEEDEERINQLLDSYAPLSNLPTPPPSGETSPIFITMPKDIPIDAQFRVPAQYLSTLVRREAGGHHPSVDRIAHALQKSRRAQNEVAFAACILDRLSWRFVRDWRKACDNAQENYDPARKWWLIRSIGRRPEVIVLAALWLANSWLDDAARPVEYWAALGECRFSCKELAATQKCILQDKNINYSLCKISLEEVLVMWQEMYAPDLGGADAEQRVEKPSSAVRLPPPSVKEGVPVQTINAVDVEDWLRQVH